MLVGQKLKKKKNWFTVTLTFPTEAALVPLDPQYVKVGSHQEIKKDKERQETKNRR